MRGLLIPLVAALWVTAGGSIAAPASYGANLLVNPSAEAPQPEAKVAGWTGPANIFGTDDYGHVSGEWDWGLSGCAGCGKRYFRLEFEGDQNQQQAATQTVDLSSLAADIDAGRVTARLSGELGGYRSSDTTTWLEAVFEDASGKALATLKTAETDPAALPAPERGSTSLAPVEITGPIPAGARKAQVRLVAKPTGSSGSYLGLADKLSFSLVK